MTVPEVNGDSNVPDNAAGSSKPKRVRTGCLTCRERHLKCDEGLPNCHNCNKSNRICKRGLRLNFIDTQVQSPPCVPPTSDWKVTFQDESREIASEYQGGLARYGQRDAVKEDASVAQPHAHADSAIQLDFNTTAPQAPSLSYQELPPIQGILPDAYMDEAQGQSQLKYDPSREQYQQGNNNRSTNDSPFSAQNTVHGGSTTSYGHPQSEVDPLEKREFLNTQEEVLFMQVFVEEVGLWMDSMDPMKHVCIATLSLHPRRC